MVWTYIGVAVSIFALCMAVYLLLQTLIYGVDAPEAEQNCFLNGRPWSCGPVAYREMEKILFEEGGPVTCTPRDAVDAEQARGDEIGHRLVRAAQPAGQGLGDQGRREVGIGAQQRPEHQDPNRRGHEQQAQHRGRQRIVLLVHHRCVLEH